MNPFSLRVPARLTPFQEQRLQQLTILDEAYAAYEARLEEQIREVAGRRRKIEDERMRLQDIEMGRAPEGRQAEGYGAQGEAA